MSSYSMNEGCNVDHRFSAELGALRKKPASVAGVARTKSTKILRIFDVWSSLPAPVPGLAAF